MKRDSIRTHLRPYSIYGRRITTINHAFASAIALNDDYDDARMSQAIRVLGQDPDADLLCAYCESKPAQTWDHVFGLVSHKQYAGYGHTICNLLPCCRDCNSQKGNRDWRSFLKTKCNDEAAFLARAQKLERYFAEFGTALFDQLDMMHLCPDEMQRYTAIQQQITVLMKEADVIAEIIRHKVKTHLQT